MLNIQKILVPTDFSPASNLAVKYGKELAVMLDAKLTVLHVSDDPIIFSKTTSDEYREEHIDKVKVELDQNLREVLGDASAVKIAALCGSATTEIIDYAKKEDFDLVVMGSHGRSAMASMLLGNVAEHVVRHCPCPVTTVRSPEHDFR